MYRKDINNYNHKVNIQVDSVFRNNRPENFSTKIENKDLAIYIGREYLTLPHDTYEYTIKYWTTQQVGFFDGYDEIYWNVNGNDWLFDVDSVTATVYLPQGAKFINNACYTGKSGSTANECSYQSIGDSIVEFYANTHFGHKEGLTIATSFTPNIIKRPPPPIPLDGFMDSIGIFILLAIGVLFVLYYYFVTVRKINTMNGHQIVIPTFDPPLNKSAQVLSYLNEKEVDNKTFMACILSMAVKKTIHIKNERSVYTLIDLGQTDQLSEEELIVYQNMFVDGAKEVTFGNKKRTLPNKALSILETTLKTNIKLEDYFLPKKSYFLKFNICTAISIGVWLIILYLTTRLQLQEIFDILHVSFSVLSFLVLYYLKSKIRFPAFFVLLVMGSANSINDHVRNTNLYLITLLFIFFLLIINILFHYYIRPMTKMGAEFSGELKGFIRYLIVTEENRLNTLMPPDFTPEQFERMLPYAVALGLEIKWAKKFAKKVLPTDNYQPSWYEGKAGGSYIKFTKRLSSSLYSSVTNSITNMNSSGNSYGNNRGWRSGSGSHGSSGGGGGRGRGW